MNKKTLQKLKKGLVIIKFTLFRGFGWCQLPALALMGAGILYPYVVSYYPKLHLWQVAVVAFIIMSLVGWLDFRFRLLHEEQNYMTKTSPTLMAGLKGKLK